MKKVFSRIFDIVPMFGFLMSLHQLYGMNGATHGQYLTVFVLALFFMSWVVLNTVLDTLKFKVSFEKEDSK